MARAFKLNIFANMDAQTLTKHTGMFLVCEYVNVYVN